MKVNKLDQAHRDVAEAQRRLDSLERAKEDAGRIRDLEPSKDAGSSEDAGYAARRDELERELAKARDEVRIQEKLEGMSNATEIDVSVDNDGTVESSAPVGVEASPAPMEAAADPARTQEVIEREVATAEQRLKEYREKGVIRAELVAPPPDPAATERQMGDAVMKFDAILEASLEEDVADARAELDEFLERATGRPAGDAGLDAPPFIDPKEGEALDKMRNDEEMRAAERRVAPDALGDAKEAVSRMSAETPEPSDAFDRLAFDPLAREQSSSDTVRPSAPVGAAASPTPTEDVFGPASLPDDDAFDRPTSAKQFSDEVDELLRVVGDDEPAGFPAFAKGGTGEFVDGARAKAEGIPASYEPLPPPQRKLQVTPESPSIPEGGYVKARVEITDREREANAANIDKWRNATTIDPTPDRQPHAAHGRQAHAPHGAQAHPAHGLPKKPLLVAAIGIVIALVGVTTVVARPPARDAAPTAPLATPAIATAVPAVAGATAASTRAAPTISPIGATIAVTAIHRWSEGSACRAEPASVEQRTLGTKMVSNPPVGDSVAYEWLAEWPSCASGRSWTLEYERPTFAPANTLFRPKTTYSISPLERGTCSGGRCSQPMIVIVKNEGSL